MTVCCQNLTLGALSRRSALSMLDGALFKKFGLFLNTTSIPLLQLWAFVACSRVTFTFTFTCQLCAKCYVYVSRLESILAW